MTKGDIAKRNFEHGCNCAQAVLLAFCEDYGLDRETAVMISASFGAGMGGLREACGTVTGANMVIGLAKGNSRTAANNVFREFVSLFQEENGSIICRELLTKRAQNHRTCADLCKCAGDILEKLL